MKNDIVSTEIVKHEQQQTMCMKSHLTLTIRNFTEEFKKYPTYVRLIVISIRFFYRKSILLSCLFGLSQSHWCNENIFTQFKGNLNFVVVD